jgi:hypothetical protein
MIKCKILIGKTPLDIENSINRWFMDNSYTIISQSMIFNPIAEHHFVVSIFYDDGNYEYSSSDTVPQPGRNSKIKH